MPVSAMPSTMHWLTARARTVTWPPAGVNFTALESRLSTICLSARRSARRLEVGRDAGGELELLVAGAGGDDAHRLVEQRVEAEILEVEADAAGLDLGHVEHVVDDVEQVFAARVDVLAVFLVFVGAERAEHAQLHDLREADDGVERRAQLVAHIGEEFRLRLVGFLGAGLLGGVFLGELAEALLRGAQVGDRRHQPALAVDQLLLVRLQRRDVGADRDVAAVLGAALADVQPAAVLELRLEGAGAGQGRTVADDLVAHHRLAAGGHHGLVGRADGDRLVRQVVQLLEIGVAEHQPVVGVPQHEGLGDGLDGVAQPHVGGDGLLHQALLLGDVDGDADQMQAGIVRLVHQLAARAQPDPVAVGVTHAEGVVDRGDLGVGKLRGEVVELHVVGVDQRADAAEGQEVVLALHAEDIEHRLRPEDAAAGEVPVPQAAAAAVERGVDAAAHRLVDDVGLARPCRLPVEGEAEDQHDEAGGGRQRDGEGRERAPARQRRGARLHHGELAVGGFEHAHGGERAGVVGQHDFQHAGAGAEGGQGLGRAEQVEQAAADRGGRVGRRRDHGAVAIGEEELAAGGGRPGRQRARKHVLRPGVTIAVLHLHRGEIGGGAEHGHVVGDGLAALVEHLHGRADADGDEKCEDQHRNGAAQKRLGRQEPAIGRLGDRLREAFDRIRLCRRTRHIGARHKRPPFGMSPPPWSGRMCRISPNHWSIGIDGR